MVNVIVTFPVITVYPQQPLWVVNTPVDILMTSPSTAPVGSY